MREGGVLVTLSYVSRALVHDGDPVLREIVAAAEARNGAADVTGALYFDDALFFQVLEGPEPAVRAIFDSIRADPRHDAVRVLAQEPLARRRFLGWRMKFARPTALPRDAPRVIHRAFRRPAAETLDAAIDALR